jgi:DNA-binding MarR family transcriptional regulator
VRLRLTPEGQAVNDALRRKARKLSAVAVKGFTEQDRVQLAALLHRVQANLEDAAEGQ